ncbi:fused protease/ribonucleoside-triphosphate reductase [Streptomyces albus subsp. chlorinus]|nr:fused protease/ribonucleoside-triphosphate reductase [Streptomyces albus]NSC25218.1 fused protease/ribonucleoside-triphosphate reductase [Streptomyces albus subsp. chlorinus]
MTGLGSSGPTFRLDEEFFAGWRRRPPEWGFDIGSGNTLGELVFLARYSRVTSSGAKETWADCVRRVVEGTFSLLRAHCAAAGRRWDRDRLGRAAEDMFARMYTMRWLPPGRGLWMMGTDFVRDEGGAALQSCAFVSTAGLAASERSEPFVRLMEMCLLGVGVGFDTAGRGRLRIGPEPATAAAFVIPDSREGWSESLRLLLDAFLRPGRPMPRFDYAKLRPAGAPIARFGGVASGPAPLQALHESVTALLRRRAGRTLGTADLVDLMNLIGKCVASGNIGRSAEIALGDRDDPDFLDLKNPKVHPDRMGPNGWGHLSNNSLVVDAGDDCEALVDRIAANGEPGLFFRRTAQRFGRLADPPDERDLAAVGTNPCAEQTLEDRECCTLVETFPTRHRSLTDYLATLRTALLYAKAVTLMDTRWPDSNDVMRRNRRIGCSMSGLAQFRDAMGAERVRTWLDQAYRGAKEVDASLSAWLGIPRSVKLTSVKPSGTVSLLAGVSPGVHFPEGAPQGGTCIRRLRTPSSGPVAEALAAAGYRLEPDVMSPADSVVVELPVGGHPGRVASEVGVREQLALAVTAQRYWADNQVSVTLTVREEELAHLRQLLRRADLGLKAASFLPRRTAGAYPQMPYEPLAHDRFLRLRERVGELDRRLLYGGAVEPEGERFCTSDRCL